MDEVCGAAAPFDEMPGCQLAPAHEGNHRAVWQEDGGTSSLTWADAETIREALRPQRVEATKAWAQQQAVDAALRRS